MLRSFYLSCLFFLLFPGWIYLLEPQRAVADTADHLVISEVLIRTRIPVITFGSPFIEITNPTGQSISMRDVYITDATTAPVNYYFNLPLLDPAGSPPGGGIGGDFHARFPDGYVLPAGQSIAISLNGSDEYQEAYGRSPDFELFEDALAPDTVPELVEAFPGSINAGLAGGGNIPVLSDVSESLMLYSWDGQADLVLDLDYLMWGANLSPRIDKTGVSIGSGTYLPDTPAASQEAAAAAAPTFSSVFRRIGADEGAEVLTGGNGISGHDETSENLGTTFPTVVGPEPPPANNLFPAAPIFTDGFHTPATPYEGQPVTLETTVIDQGVLATVDFHYLVAGNLEQIVAGTEQGSGTWTITVPPLATGAVVDWYCVATNTEGGTAVFPAGSPNFAATFSVSAPPGPDDFPAKLLLTEISTLGTQEEFIEVFNPGSEAVDLSDYYLTDANYSPGNQFYYRIGEGNPTQISVGGGMFNDFNARFPSDYHIAPGDTIVISVTGSTGFFNSFGFHPDLELFEDGPTPDAVADMRWIFGDEFENSIFGSGSTPTLTNAAEPVILYHYVTGEDKITDIDVFVWKSPSSTSTSLFFNKTGVTIGSHMYLPEIGTNDAFAFDLENVFGTSYQRIDITEGGQAPSGSNGVGGSDETSEDFNTTFAMMPYEPASPPAPFVYPDKLLITEVSTTGTDQEYIEICNPGIDNVDLSDYYLTDAIYSTANQVYWRITQGNLSQVTVGGGAFFDFHARFPDGFSLAAGDTIVITLPGSNAFFTSFGFFPHLEMFEDGAAPDTIPDMRWIFGDDINNSIINRTGSGAGQPSNPGLTNGGETVVLYHWLADQDRVTDIDVFVWKDPSYSTTSFFFNKSGVTIGSHSYLPEIGTNATDAFGAQASFGNSYQRTDPSEGDQIPTGSNGVDGRDETSEDFNITFQLLPYDPFERPGIVVPPEGDWQIVGFGPIVAYPSVAHTWGDFDDNGRDDLLLVRPGLHDESLLIHDAEMFLSGPVEPLDGALGTARTGGVRGDYDQDGDLDVYVTKDADIDWVYNNTGEEWDWWLWPWAVNDLGIDPTLATTGAEMVDTDLDGWLEIFVINGEGNSQLLDGRYALTDLMPYSLFHEQGTTGSAWCDLDGDRDPDLAFVTSEGVAIAMQDEPRRFTTTWLSAPPAGRDCAWADFDNDGDFDFVLACDGSNNVVFQNLGDNTFSQSPLIHDGDDSTTGCAWGDYNNDGLLDLHVTNKGGPNVLWRNESAGQFAAVTDTVINDPGNDRGSSWVDIDEDGDLDLYFSNPDHVNRLVRNNLDSQNNWLQIEVTGQHWGNQSNLGAIGAVIEVEAGGLVQRRHVGGMDAGPGHSPSLQHFGLGSATTVNRITVHWPFRFPNGSFHSTEVRDVAVNQRMEIEETVYGVSGVGPVPRFTNNLMAARPNPFNPATAIGFSLEREAVVCLDIFDVRGRLVRRLVPGRTLPAGLHQLEWRGQTENGAIAPSGVYIYRLTAGDFSASRRMVLIK